MKKPFFRNFALPIMFFTLLSLFNPSSLLSRKSGSKRRSKKPAYSKLASFKGDIDPNKQFRKQGFYPQGGIRVFMRGKRVKN